MTQPISQNTQLRFRDALPDQVDLVIIGGGVIGVFAALYLARDGQRVLLCEKGRIAGEQSSRNWGWIRQQGRDRAELPIMMQARELWKEIDRDTNGGCGLRETGTLYLSSDENAKDGFDDWIETAKTHDLDSRLLSASEVDALFGCDTAGRWARCLHTPSDCRGEPWRAVPTVAQLAQETGAHLRENCAVRALDITAGEVTGVITEDGPVQCAQVILAAGAWSSLFSRRHGVSIPQLSVRATAARTAPLPQIFDGCACDEKLALRRREDGCYTLALADRQSYFLGPDGLRNAVRYLPAMKTAWHHIVPRAAHPPDFPDAWRVSRRWSEDETSPFERMRVLEPTPDQVELQRITARFAARFPEIGAPTLSNTWAGMIDVMPDIVPIVDRAEKPKGLIIATGMSGHGFGIGPGYGEILMRLATGKPAGFDLRRFRIGRFSDGSPIDVGPGL